jgi:hypothetical protein
MSAVATLPRAGGNGAALVVVVADLFMGLYAAFAPKRAPKAQAAPEAAAEPENKMNLWQPYRPVMIGIDSLNPVVWAKLN